MGNLLYDYPITKYVSGLGTKHVSGLPGSGEGDSHIKRTGALVANFKKNP